MTLPARMTASEVIALARFSRQTLRRRIKRGAFPKPVDEAREQIFDRDAVLKALGMVKDEQPVPAPEPEFAFDADAFNRDRARRVRHDAATPARRNAARVLPGPGTAAPLRLAVSNPSSADGRP